VHLRNGISDASDGSTETMVNGHSITHGGFVFALADTGFTVAGNSMAGPRWAGAAIAYVDSTSLGDDELVAQGR